MGYSQRRLCTLRTHCTAKHPVRREALTEGWFGTALWGGEKKQADHVKWLWASRNHFHLAQADQAGVEEGQPSLLSQASTGHSGPSKGT